MTDAHSWQLCWENFLVLFDFFGFGAQLKHSFFSALLRNLQVMLLPVGLQVLGTKNMWNVNVCMNSGKTLDLRIIVLDTSSPNESIRDFEFLPQNSIKRIGTPANHILVFQSKSFLSHLTVTYTVQKNGHLHFFEHTGQLDSFLDVWGNLFPLLRPHCLLSLLNCKTMHA